MSAVDDDNDERFRAAGLRWRPVGGMELAACTGKSELLRNDGGRAGLLSREKYRRAILRTKRRSRFPVGSGTLLDPSQEFPGWNPKLWLIANQRDAVHLLG